MSTRDLIIGAYTNYNWDQIKYWANSIVQSGFSGDKVVIAYNSHADTVNKLASLGFTVLTFNKDYNGNYVYPAQPLIIVVDRFLHLWSFLNQIPANTYRYVISTDMKDVVFQQNPSEWLEKNIHNHNLVASCESITYQNEPWGNDNLHGSFPMIHENLLDKPIWNCGVQAGTSKIIKDLWIQIYLLSKAALRPNGDQAAYNILLNSEVWRTVTRFTMSEDGWACQAGTTVDPSKIESFKKYLLEPQPTWVNGLACTSNGTPHYILHQWDRIPEWHDEIKRRYG